MTDQPSIVILTSSGPEHRYVANRIAQEIPVRAIIVLDQPKRQVKKYWRAGPRALLGKVLLRLFLIMTKDERKRAQALEKVLGKERCAHFPRSVEVKELGSPSAGQLAEVIKALHPDAIALYGTGKIHQAVLDTAREQVFNMHTGLSPYYRGTACAFWPIVNNEPHMVGATVHECTAALDAGKIYHSRRASLDRSDDLHMIFARAVRVGTDGYVEVLRDYCRGRLTGSQQRLELGREYKGNMRGLGPELRARWNLRKLRQRGALSALKT